MSVIASINCLRGSHEPLRRDVEWNGKCYVGACRHCGKPIERKSHRKWREASVETA
ncbi:hypothetical protein [Erythrobacter sp. KY5]|uniref:hypothetical protein n=1 Tax=Erythrobacter sp. KY5 TaxID=2011159 RepID=UPI0013A7072D|nr:hypothetical protein [Erythrobacter sp. KY5]